MDSVMKRNCFDIQKAVVMALIIRETKTRFGKYRLGYLWAVLEPTAHLLIMLAIFGYVMGRTMPDISFSVFLVNGIIPYFIFSDISVRSIKAIESNQGLFNYRPVKPIDTLIARVVLESIIYVFSYAILMSFLFILGEQFSLFGILMLSCTWLLLIIFSCGVGLIFMVIGNIVPETERFLPIIIKPLYFASCVMYPLHAIPKEYWPYLLWNPLVHAVELSREAVVSHYVSGGVSLEYLALSALGVFFFGLFLYWARKETMLTSS